MRPSDRLRKQGIRQKGNRLEANVRVRGQLHTKTFPLDTSIDAIQAWRRSQRIAPITTGTLASDIELYATTIQHMPSKAERLKHLEWWANTLGPTRPRSTITTQDVNAALSALAKAKAPTTVRHYRTALLHLYHRLDGHSAANPVKASWRPADPPPLPRAIPPATVRAILKAMQGPKTKARLWLMASTGLPHTQLMQLTPQSIDWEHNRVFIPARKKGKGAAGRWLPLNRHARFALRAMDRAEAWGKFSRESMRETWKRALRRIGLPEKRWRVYDIRHSVGTMLYQATGDLATVARLLGHADPRTASRYSLAAHEETDQFAMAKVRLPTRPKLETPKNKR